MVSAAIEPELQRQLDALPAHLQRRVLVFAQSLAVAELRAARKKALLKLAGTLPAKDAAEMLAAIEEGCDQVDADGW